MKCALGNMSLLGGESRLPLGAEVDNTERNQLQRQLAEVGQSDASCGGRQLAEVKNTSAGSGGHQEPNSGHKSGAPSSGEEFQNSCVRETCQQTTVFETP
jgi:hypothetical protein